MEREKNRLHNQGELWRTLKFSKTFFKLDIEGNRDHRLRTGSAIKQTLFNGNFSRGKCALIHLSLPNLDHCVRKGNRGAAEAVY